VDDREDHPVVAVADRERAHVDRVVDAGRGAAQERRTKAAEVDAVELLGARIDRADVDADPKFADRLIAVAVAGRIAVTVAARIAVAVAVAARISIAVAGWISVAVTGLVLGGHRGLAGLVLAVAGSIVGAGNQGNDGKTGPGTRNRGGHGSLQGRREGGRHPRVTP